VGGGSARRGVVGYDGCVARGPRHRTVLWARNPDVARAIDQEHTNPDYLPGLPLASELTATDNLERAVSVVTRSGSRASASVWWVRE
jgi:glycerol-3-phosphate dehydrogenase